jgi:hypothetical protein
MHSARVHSCRPGLALLGALEVSTVSTGASDCWCVAELLWIETLYKILVPCPCAQAVAAGGIRAPGPCLHFKQEASLQTRRACPVTLQPAGAKTCDGTDFSKSRCANSFRHARRHDVVTSDDAPCMQRCEHATCHVTLMCVRIRHHIQTAHRQVLRSLKSCGLAAANDPPFGLGSPFAAISTICEQHRVVQGTLAMRSCRSSSDKGWLSCPL